MKNQFGEHPQNTMRWEHKQNIHPETFDIRDVVKEVSDLLNPIASAKNISLDFRNSYKYPLLVEADKSSIFQVFTNLITNAIKYGRENGYVAIGFYDNEENVTVEVSDNGIGFPAEHLPHLFEHFYRADRGESYWEGGSESGLAIVKHIIETHNQTINVCSLLGIGTIFSFTLNRG